MVIRERRKRYEVGIGIGVGGGFELEKRVRRRRAGDDVGWLENGDSDTAHAMAGSSRSHSDQTRTSSKGKADFSYPVSSAASSFRMMGDTSRLDVTGQLRFTM